MVSFCSFLIYSKCIVKVSCTQSMMTAMSVSYLQGRHYKIAEDKFSEKNSRCPYINLFKEGAAGTALSV